MARQLESRLGVGVGQAAGIKARGRGVGQAAGIKARGRGVGQ